MGFWEEYFDLKYFIFAFCFGIFCVYIAIPTPEIIIKYPTPDNAGKVIYEDNAGTCYVYKSKEVSCPSSGAIDTPLQHTNNKPKDNGFLSKYLNM